MTQLYTEVSKLAPKLSGNIKTNQKKQAVNELVASLFNTVRMAEWEYVSDESKLVCGVPTASYKFPLNKQLALIVTPTTIVVRKGKSIRVYPIGHGKEAERLFNSIKHAQAVIAKAIAEQDKQVTAFCEAFDIDAELAENSSILGEALEEAASSKNDDAVSADKTRVDIKIKPAPTSIAPAETSVESESAAALLTDEDKEVVLQKIGDARQAIKALEAEIGEEAAGFDPIESDIFAEALNETQPQQSSVVDAFATEEPETKEYRGGMAYAQPPDKIIASIKSLQGRILGIVDASFSDKEQRAAVKTLVNKEFRREMEKF